HRDLRRRSLRDPERRLLRRDHAAEHRRRQGSRRGGPFRRQVCRRRSRRIPSPRRDLTLSSGAMLDLKLIRSDPERVKSLLARRGAAEQVDELLALDARRRELLPRIESAQAERKTISKRIGEAKQRGEEAAEQMAAVAELKGTIESGKAELEQVD